MGAVLVCASCFEGLVARGATARHEKREGSLLDRCQAHPSSVPVHAALVVDAEPEIVERWYKDEWRSREIVPYYETLHVPPPGSVLIASLAANVLGGASGPGLGANAADIEQAVTIARQLLAVSKGERL